MEYLHESSACDKKQVLLETLWINGKDCTETSVGCVLWGTKPNSGTHPSFDEQCYALSSSHFPSREGINFTSNRLPEKFPVLPKNNQIF